ncbi:hypothetical protein K432DRAFT_311556 [Lepidopterella palustris CBS 459.81]|uniref:Transcription factor domain-containing protein n=1 Tax=Lepidopterella palustris CBS 459.81 TaxID=1314670 RepID=A0A8E2J985_9PEZI|nr:hypothetical protein K432DRAFT_311556 [Lepidopterella palustris CBS 459.81]
MSWLEAKCFLWKHNIHTLQALILLCYGTNHTYGNTWAILGLTQNITISLGSHIDPETLGLDLLRSEERRRRWAGIMMLYTIQNTSMDFFKSLSKSLCRPDTCRY